MPNLFLVSQFRLFVLDWIITRGYHQCLNRGLEIDKLSVTLHLRVFLITLRVNNWKI